MSVGSVTSDFGRRSRERLRGQILCAERRLQEGRRLAARLADHCLPTNEVEALVSSLEHLVGLHREALDRLEKTAA